MKANDELFFFEQNRCVRKDNTFQIHNVRYEAPRELSGCTIQVRFSRADPKRIVVYYKDERMGEATKLDFLNNDRAPSLQARREAEATRRKISEKQKGHER